MPINIWTHLLAPDMSVALALNVDAQAFVRLSPAICNVQHVLLGCAASLGERFSLVNGDAHKVSFKVHEC